MNPDTCNDITRIISRKIHNILTQDPQWSWEVTHTDPRVDVVWPVILTLYSNDCPFVRISITSITGNYASHIIMNTYCCTTGECYNSLSQDIRLLVFAEYNITRIIGDMCNRLFRGLENMREMTTDEIKRRLYSFGFLLDTR